MGITDGFGFSERHLGLSLTYLPVIGRMVGPRLTESEIGRRQIATPLLKAELGAEAVQDGFRRNDEGLRQYGAALVVAAYVETTDIHGYSFPQEIADGVSGIASGLPAAEVSDNPYISPEHASKVSAILWQYPG